MIPTKITNTTQEDPIKSKWHDRLHSALRTALACTIVGLVTLYGPERIRNILTYSAFSYVTTILIVSEATLGDAIRGCLHVLYATVQVMVPSTLTLWLVGPERFNGSLAAAAVAITAFVVAFPNSTPILAKRIAFGQTVIVYVGTVVHGKETGVFMHPVHVAASTTLGALASVLALLVPYPRLACREVNKAYKSYIENASQRFNILAEAFKAQDTQAAYDLISQAQAFTKIGARHIQTIKDAQEGIIWERPHIRFLKPNYMHPGGNLRDMEIPIWGMEFALKSYPSFPVGNIDEGFAELCLIMKEKVGLKLARTKMFVPFYATIAPETKRELPYNSTWKPQTNIITKENFPTFFFLYCMDFLRDYAPVSRCSQTTKTQAKSHMKDPATPSIQKTWRRLDFKATEEKMTFALKCSISLGFAVLFGLMFSKNNGYWSGLTIAISFTSQRQATFTMANARAQGTAMGSVYGVLCCFLLHRYVELKFLPLLPWIIFTSFLRHSRMYGQAGGISAVIGALLILGRKHYGSPTDFAIERLTEACIGLICFITVETLLQPTRAGTLARSELATSLGALRDCVNAILSGNGQESPSIPSELREKQRKLTSHINELERFISEAEQEPNFWFRPFNSVCYDTFLGSLRNMENLLRFESRIIENLLEVSECLGIDWKELEQIFDDLDLYQEKVGTSLKFFEDVILIKTLKALDKKLQKKNSTDDIEMGKAPEVCISRSLVAYQDILKVESSFLEHWKKLANTAGAREGEQKLKSQMTLLLGSLGFCIISLVKGTTELEKELKELLMWENPTMLIDFDDLSSKINVLLTE